MFSFAEQFGFEK